MKTSLEALFSSVLRSTTRTGTRCRLKTGRLIEVTTLNTTKSNPWTMGAFTFRLTRLTTLYRSWLWLTRVSWITTKLFVFLIFFFGAENAYGLCHVLSKPCRKPEPTMWDLAPTYRDKWEISRDEIQLLRRSVVFFNFLNYQKDKTRFLGWVVEISERFFTASGRTSTRWLWKRYERALCPRRLFFKRRPLWKSSDIKDW